MSVELLGKTLIWRRWVRYELRSRSTAFMRPREVPRSSGEPRATINLAEAASISWNKWWQVSLSKNLDRSRKFKRGRFQITIILWGRCMKTVILTKPRTLKEVVIKTITNSFSSLKVTLRFPHVTFRINSSISSKLLIFLRIVISILTRGLLLRSFRLMATKSTILNTQQTLSQATSPFIESRV